MGVKVAKFGGSSVADGIQLTKTKQIIEQDPSRKFIVVSAPGKRFDGDNKITDLLYLCKTHMEHNLPYDQVFQVVADRYMAVALNLGVEANLMEHLDEIKENLKKNPIEVRYYDGLPTTMKEFEDEYLENESEVDLDE